MNFSMFFKLFKAMHNEKIHIDNSYKNLDYMLEKDWLKRESTGIKVTQFNGAVDAHTEYSDYYFLTNKGKESYLKSKTSAIVFSVSIVIAAILIPLLIAIYL